MLDLQSYLRGKGRNVPLKKGRLDLTSYMLGKASNGVQELSGTLPLYVRSRASQILQNYIIYGTASGAGVRTKNLLDISNVNNNTYGISAKEEDGSLHIYGKSNRNSAFVVNLLTPDKPTAADTNFSLKAGTYTLSGMIATTNSMARLQIIDETETETTLDIDDGSGATFTLADDSIVRVRLNFRGVAYNVPVDITIKPMLRPADTTADFEPYGYKIPITVTSNGTTTDYPVYIGDSKLKRIPDTDTDCIDYKKGKIVRRVKKVVLTGEESNYGFGEAWDSLGSPNGDHYCTYTYEQLGMTDIIDYMKKMNNIVYPRYTSTHFTMKTFGYSDFKIISNGQIGANSVGTVFSNKYIIFGTSIQTIDQWKQFLADQYSAGTPVTVWYTLETPIEEDPPVPLPDIALPQATVTIDIEGDLKPQATVKGKIEQIT